MNKYSESLMYKKNKDLPYEQQIKALFYHYDRLMEGNKALKARIKEMEDEKAEYGNLKKFCTFIEKYVGNTGI